MRFEYPFKDALGPFLVQVTLSPFLTILFSCLSRVANGTMKRLVNLDKAQASDGLASRCHEASAFVGGPTLRCNLTIITPSVCIQ
jgi:hypothetical protein